MQTSFNQAEWCPVDIYGLFEFNGATYRIPKTNKDYKVNNRAFDNYDYSNEAKMDQVLAVLCNDQLYFYDMNMKEIDVDRKGRLSA